MKIFKDFKEVISTKEVNLDLKKEIAELSELILKKIKQGKFRGNGWKR